MRISDLLHSRVVLPGVAARSKEDVLELLAARLAGEYPEIDQRELTAALRERERQMTTALADGVAIPHARVRGLRRVVAAFGRSVAGIDCGSHDGKPTHFFLLLVVPEESPGTHLKVLATASRLLHDERCRARLLQAPDEDTLLDALRAEEDRTRGAARAA
jgi:mannitol/fructose-specific phosphotransferase system IIA component (Ntr-type)